MRIYQNPSRSKLLGPMIGSRENNPEIGPLRGREMGWDGEVKEEKGGFGFYSWESLFQGRPIISCLKERNAWFGMQAYTYCASLSGFPHLGALPLIPDIVPELEKHTHIHPLSYSG